MTAKTDLAIATVRIIGFNIGCFMPDGQLVFIQLTPVLPTEQYKPTISKLSIVLEGEKKNLNFFPSLPHYLSKLQICSDCLRCVMMYDAVV